MRKVPFLLVCTLACLVGAAIAQQAKQAKQRGSPPVEGLWISHGPMLGRPGPTSMGVWARTSVPGEFRVRYGLSPDALNTVSGNVATRLENDNTGWMLLQGLKPATRYHYVVETPVGEENRATQPGSFRTLPDPAQFREPALNPEGLFNVTFEFGSCNNQSYTSGGPTTPVFRTMLDQIADKIDFAILNGDWIYEERRDYPIERWMAQVGVKPDQLPPLLNLIPTVSGVWENYKLYLERSTSLAEWHRRIPTYYTYDDHEILGDIPGAGQVGLRERRSLFRDIAVKAWYDYLGWSNPLKYTQEAIFGRAQLWAGSNILTDTQADFMKYHMDQGLTLHVHWGDRTAGVKDRPAGPGDPNAAVYEVMEVLDKHRLRIRPAPKQDSTSVYSIGRRSHYDFRVSNSHFFVLDCRGERNLPDLSDPNKPGMSLLGKKQKAWLKEGMRNSDARFLFVVSSVNFMVSHPSKGDSWTWFLDEREQMTRFFDSLGKPVFLLTGDLHASYTIKISDRLWEICSGPHNSLHHLVRASGYPPNGIFDSGGRKCEMRWSSYLANDTDNQFRRAKRMYTVVQVNSVYNNPKTSGKDRWVAWPSPYVIFRHHDALTGELLYAETVHAPKAREMAAPQGQPGGP